MSFAPMGLAWQEGELAVGLALGSASQPWPVEPSLGAQIMISLSTLWVADIVPGGAGSSIEGPPGICGGSWGSGPGSCSSVSAPGVRVYIGEAGWSPWGGRLSPSSAVQCPGRGWGAQASCSRRSGHSFWGDVGG